MVAKFLDLNNISRQRRPFPLSNDGRKVWATLLNLSAIKRESAKRTGPIYANLFLWKLFEIFLGALMHRKVIHVNFFPFFCDIGKVKVSWDPKILLPWQRDVMTSSFYFFNSLYTFLF